MAVVIYYLFLLFCMVILYPAFVVVYCKSNGDNRNIITIIRKEC